jgi:type IV secretory pathway VirB2 component (pilin)
MNVLFQPIPRCRFASWRWLRQIRQSTTLFFLLVLFPAMALAQSGSPFDTGFTALQTLFTGTIAKVASLIAIVIGGYQFAHGDPGAKRFDHGYAVTSHTAQGLTAERVLIHADTSVHPDLLSSRFGYVAVSRASHETTIFTDDLNRFGHQLSAEVNKTSALEIGQASSIGIDQGLGIV